MVSLSSAILALPLTSAVIAAVALPPGGAGDGARAIPSAEPLGLLPRGLTSFGAEAHGGWLYVLGGYHGEPHAYSIEGQSDAFLAINLLDPADVRMLGDVAPVQSVELVASSPTGELVQIGGMHARNAAGEPADLRSTDAVRAYDPATDAWRDLPALPEPRSSHRAVAAGSRVYVVGGWELTGAGGGGGRWATDALVFDLADEAEGWRSIDAPFRARAVGAAVAGGELVVVGGLTPEDGVTSATWILDLATEQWREGPAFPDSGFGLASAERDGAALASGRSGVVYALAEGAAEWSEAARLAHGRIFHELVVAGGSDLVALGGIVGMGTRGRVRLVERVDLGGGTDAAPAVSRYVVPAPAAARNRFGLHVEGRSAYLFGGNTSLGQHDFEPEHFSAESWRFDFGARTWTRLADMPAPRQSMQTLPATGLRGALVVGGFAHDGDDARTQGTSWVHDAEFDEWEEGPALPGTRTQFALVERDGQQWILGGLDYDPARGREGSFDHRVDVLTRPAAGDAPFAASDHTLPRPRRAFAAALVGSRVHMVGGMQAGFQPVEEVDVLDLDTGEWSTAPAPSRVRIGADLVEVDGALYLVGGSSRPAPDAALEPDRRIERFDPATGAWEVVLDDLGVDVKHARAFELDGRVAVLTLHHEGPPRAEVVTVDVARLPSGPRR